MADGEHASGHKRRRPEAALNPNDDADDSDYEPPSKRLSVEDELNLRILTNMPQIKNYRPDKRGRRGAVFLGNIADLEYIDALADAMATTHYLPKSAEPTAFVDDPAPTTTEPSMSANSKRSRRIKRKSSRRSKAIKEAEAVAEVGEVSRSSRSNASIGSNDSNSSSGSGSSDDSDDDSDSDSGSSSDSGNDDASDSSSEEAGDNAVSRYSPAAEVNDTSL